MKINSIRIYAEVLEQGLDFKEYIKKAGFKKQINNIYTKKARAEFSKNDSLMDRIRKVKDFDVIISAISDNQEFPLVLIEYSTAVPTDDHKMQRSDVYYWAKIFKIPVMKISPTTKNIKQAFGGGNKFNNELEMALAYQKGAILYPIYWNCINNKDILQTKPYNLSCIEFSKEIYEIIKKIIFTFESSKDFQEYYSKLYSDYKATYSNIINSYSIEDIKSMLCNSSRFDWKEGSVKIKINRFGHAMDPDRGILYFLNMLVGIENITTEIQINRDSKYNSRGGYKSLFDGLSREPYLKKYIQNIIKTKNNIFSAQDAIHIFIHAFNIENSLKIEKLSKNNYYINNDNLMQFLKNHPSMVAKSIFYLSSKLQLTDKSRNIICNIEWDNSVIKKYLNTIKTNNYMLIPIKSLTYDDAKEDIITFASVELLKKINCNIVAVSYPGAQGDRCILSGRGRTTLRTYIDIIANKNTDCGENIYLTECKDNFNKSSSDVKKLNSLLKDKNKYNDLITFLKKAANINKIRSILLSVGAKKTNNIPNFDVDYIFMFDIKENNLQTIIQYSIAIINTGVLNDFLPLAEDKKRLKGNLYYDKIYTIST